MTKAETVTVPKFVLNEVIFQSQRAFVQVVDEKYEKIIFDLMKSIEHLQLEMQNDRTQYDDRT